MTKLRLIVLASLIGASGVISSGCVVRAGVGATVATAPDPQLVEISPGVWVVSDYDEPIFFHDGFYWRQTNGYWYRSSYYYDGFVRVGTVPVYITRIRSPHRYVHYRARPGVRVRAIRNHRSNVRDHRTHQRDNRTYRRDNRTNTRDHRRDNPTYRRDNRTNTRDHRQDNRTYRRDNRTNTRDHRQDTRTKSRDHRDKSKSKTKTKVRDHR